MKESRAEHWHKTLRKDLLEFSEKPENSDLSDGDIFVRWALIQFAELAAVLEKHRIKIIATEKRTEK